MKVLSIYENKELWVPNEGGQQGFMDDYQTFICALVGGWFSGKTWAGARKLADQHVWNALDDDGQPTYIRSLAVAQTFPLARTQSIPELQQAFDEMNLSYRFVGDPKRFCFEFPDLGTKRRPSELLVRSAESPETINAWTVGAGWGDEAARWPEDRDNPKNDPLIQLIGRVRDPKAKVIQINLTFTHEGDLTRVFEDFEENLKINHALYRAPTRENPAALDFANRTAQQLTGDLAEQYLGGLALKTRGLIMYMLTKEIHLKPDVFLVKRLPLQLTLDFNISPGMHGVVGQYDSDADFFTARHVLHRPEMAVPDLVSAFDNLLRERYKWKPDDDWPWAGGRLEVFGDASGGNDTATRGESCWDVLEECLIAKGIPYTLRIPGRNPNVSDRVNSVNMAMRDGRGKSHYSIYWAKDTPNESQDCWRLYKDYRKMKWSPEGDIDKKDKKLSHASDAEGYRIFFLRPIKDLRPDHRELRHTSVSAR